MEWHTERVWCNFSLSQNVLFRRTERQLIRLVLFSFYVQRNLFLLKTRLCLPVFPDKPRCCRAIANRWRLIFVSSLLIFGAPIFFGLANKSLCFETKDRKENKNWCSIVWSATHLFVCPKMFTIFNIVCYWMLVSSAKSVCLLSAPGSRNNTNASNWYLWASFTINTTWNRTYDGTVICSFFIFSNLKRKPFRRNEKQSRVRKRACVTSLCCTFRCNVDLFKCKWTQRENEP